MKVTVTHLKAPWPAGTVPGHVVELAGLDTVPGWALGKCTPADEGAEAVSVWTSPVVPAELGATAEVKPQALIVNPAEAELSDDEKAAAALAEAEAQALAEREAAEAREKAAAAAATQSGKKKSAAGA